MLHPLNFLWSLWPIGWAKRSMILLVMQTIPGHMRVRMRRRWWWPFSRALTSDAQGSKIPRYIPAANQAARAIAEKHNGMPVSSITEVLLDVPTTAHILGGCAMGATAEDGVIDEQNRQQQQQAAVSAHQAGHNGNGNNQVQPSNNRNKRTSPMDVSVSFSERFCATSRCGRHSSRFL